MFMLRKVLAVAVGGILAAGGLAQSGEVKRADVIKTAQKAADFLVKQQNADGGFGIFKDQPASSVGYTGLVVAALVESGTAPGGKDGELVRKAVDYILKQRQPDGSICSPQAGVQSYETSIAIMALVAVDKEKHKEAIAKAKDYLIGIQDDGSKNKLSTGGIGYGSDRTMSNMSTTHYALQALKDAGVPEDSEVWKRAVAFVSACQNNSETNAQEWAAVVNDGGFVYSPTESKVKDRPEAGGKKGWRSYASMTYAGYLSLVYAKVNKDDPRIKAALKWISDNYGLDDNPGLGMEGLYYYYNTFATAMAARGEATIKDKAGKEHKWAEELAAKLAGLQAEDGSWLNAKDRWHEGNKLICTAYSLRALSRCLQFVKDAPESTAPAKDKATEALQRAL
jgi:squalene-hopene/tetraprenyl-beta-curcumene cyclase